MPDALHLVVLTDRVLASPHPVDEIVQKALTGGARAIQLRDKEADAGQLLAQAQRLRALTDAFGALLFVNDRFDVALAAGADGVHLGPEDLPVAAVRAHVPPEFLIGYSTDDPEEARRASEAGADYIGCGAVYATATKEDAGEVIGVAGLERVTDAVDVPVIAIGGITVDRAAAIATTRAAGIAVVSAVMGARDPAAAVRAMLAPFKSRAAV